MIGFVHFDKIKLSDSGGMIARFNHNSRTEEETKSAFADLSEFNFAPVPAHEDYHTMVKKRIKETEQYRTKQLRKDVVGGIEVYLDLKGLDADTANIETDNWAKISTDWLKSVFDEAPDGKSNVLHSVLHVDETSGSHIHAFIVPITKDGEFSAYHFLNDKLSHIQNDYCKYLNEHGIEVNTSKSKSEVNRMNLKKYYSKVNARAENFDNVSKDKTPVEMMEYLKESYLADMRRLDEYKRKISDALEEKKQQNYDMIKSAYEEYNAWKKDIEKYIFEKNEEKEKLETSIKELKHEQERVTKELEEMKDNLSKYKAQDEDYIIV